MVEYKIAKQSIIRKENIDINQYTISLLKEGFRVGLIDRKAIYSIQEQVMLILKDLIIRYTKGESASVKTETAESLLNSIYYAVDAYLSSFEDPDAGIEVLKSESTRAIYDKGVEIVALIFKEARQHCREIVRNKLDVPLEVYNTSITEALPEFFENYSIIFGAHDTACSLDYPLIFDDMSIRGVLYIRNYIENLETETRFCRLFDKADINKTLNRYGRKNMIDYKEYPINLFEIMFNSAFFAVLSGNKANRPEISEAQCELLQRRLRGLNHGQIHSITSDTVEKLIMELGIKQPKLVEYIHRYRKGFAARLINAVENNNLQNMVLTASGEKSQAGSNFVEADRLSDDYFRRLVRKVADCTTASDKVNMIKAEVHSIEDFLDILNSDCLFGCEYELLYSALSDMELAVLGKIVLYEQLRSNKFEQALSIASSLKTGAEWQDAFIGFAQGLSKARLKSVEGFISEIMYDGTMA